jgi:hypothetical protein
MSNGRDQQHEDDAKVPPMPTYINGRGYLEPMPDEMVLVQPCVVEALRKARDAGYEDGMSHGYAQGHRHGRVTAHEGNTPDE